MACYHTPDGRIDLDRAIVIGIPLIQVLDEVATGEVTWVGYETIADMNGDGDQTKKEHNE